MALSKAMMEKLMVAKVPSPMRMFPEYWCSTIQETVGEIL